jgi:hypothetical protein
MEPYIFSVDQGATTGISLIALILLIALLIQKEFAMGIADERARHTTQALTIALPPMVIIGLCVIVRGIAEVLR